MSVGWYGGTARSEDGEGLGWRLVGLFGGPSVLTGESRHYRHGVRAEDWAWQVRWDGLGGAAGTVYVEARQSYWERVGSSPLTITPVALAVRASRVDLAGDVLGETDRDPRAYFDARAEAWTRTQRGRWVYREDGDGRQTLTVGARSSDRHLRLYHHAPGVLRHELELKGRTAAATGAAMALGAPVSDLWASEYARLVRWA